MLLSGNSWAFIFTLAASCLILNNLASAIPVFPRERLSSTDISTAVDKIEKMLSDECNAPVKDSTGEYSKFPEMCELQSNTGEELELEKEDGGVTQRGWLGTEIGEGTFGVVFDMEKWSADPSQHHVAKWLKYKDKGLDELRNGLSVGEVADYGVNFPLQDDGGPVTSFPHLWIIMLRKKGHPLQKLKSYLRAIGYNGKQLKYSSDKERCVAYMAKVRNAIVNEDNKYMALPGGPMHDDLLTHFNNVLFWQDEDEMHANFIDWGRIKWIFENDHDGKPSKRDIEKQAEKFAEQLREPSSIYSDENHCRKYIHPPSQAVTDV